MPLIGNKLFSPGSPVGKAYPSDETGGGSGGGGKVFRGSVLNTTHPQYINFVNKKSRSNSGSSQTQNMIETTEIIMNNNRIQSSVMDLGKKLLQCARDNDIVGVEIMMRKGAPFAADWLGMTAIHFAAMNDRYDICKLLVTSGINKDARTKVDRTPLHLAAFYGHERIAQLLIENQCTINPRDMLRMTPLHWAVEKRHKSIVRLLLKYNADVTAISKFGKTPIALAVLTEQADILQELEAAKQIQQSRKFNEQHEKETNEAVNSITGPSKYDDEPVCKKSKMSQDHEKPIKPNSRLSMDHFAENIKEEKLLEHSAVNLLKSHGISIMKDDEDTSNNLLTTALQNGRQLVLSEGGKLLLDEARRMANNKSSEIHKASPSSQNQQLLNTTVAQVRIKNEEEGIVQAAPKFRPNIITKIKDYGMKPTISMKIESPNNNNDKSTKIRVMSMHDFRKLCGTGNVKSVQRIESSMNKSQLVKLKEEDKKILAHRPSIEENKKIDPIILEDYSENDGDDDGENDLPPNIIKVSAKSDQEDSSENDEPHTAVMYPPNRQPQEPRLILTRQPSTTNTSRITYARPTNVLNVGNVKLERTPVIPLLTVPEICRQLLELRKQNDELRRKYEIVQKEKEDFRNRLERLESLLLVEQTEEDYTQM